MEHRAQIAKYANIWHHTSSSGMPYRKGNVGDARHMIFSGSLHHEVLMIILHELRHSRRSLAERYLSSGKKRLSHFHGSIHSFSGYENWRGYYQNSGAYRRVRKVPTIYETNNIENTHLNTVLLFHHPEARRIQKPETWILPSSEWQEREILKYSLECVTCHNNLFANHWSEIDHFSSIFYRTNIVRIIEWINMCLESTFELWEFYRMTRALIENFCREWVEDHRDTIIKRDDADLEFEGFHEL